MNSFKFFHKNDVPLLNRALLPHEQFIPYQREDGGYIGRVIAWTPDLPGDDWIAVKYTGTMSGFFGYRLEIPQIKRIQIGNHGDIPQTFSEHSDWFETNTISNVRVIVWYFEPIVN